MTRALPPQIANHLSLPIFVAPMFLVSGPEMVIAACKAGLGGSFPAPNCRTLDELEQWLDRINVEVKRARNMNGSVRVGPWTLNLVVHSTYARREEELELVLKYKPPIVVTALGSPKSVIDAVHSYGGIVFADVNSVSFARKAVEAGVDGLVLVAAGAGGHVGPLAGFAFLPEVREFWDGPIALAGAISNGHAVRAAEILGADLAYIGTRFITATESMAGDGYREMLIDSGAEDIVLTDAITGVKANFLGPSLAAAGIGNDDKTTIDFSGDPHSAARPWKEVWSAGQGVTANKRNQSLAEIAAELAMEYAEAVSNGLKPNQWLSANQSAAAE